MRKQASRKLPLTHSHFIDHFAYIKNRSTDLAADKLLKLANNFKKKYEYGFIISFDVSGAFHNNVG